MCCLLRASPVSFSPVLGNVAYPTILVVVVIGEIGNNGRSLSYFNNKQSHIITSAAIFSRRSVVRAGRAHHCRSAID